jgi:segregation and condensation protein A
VQAPDQKDFTLENFEGPLDLLVYLVKKSEVDVGEIPIQEVMAQFIERLERQGGKQLEVGGEFLVSAASLLLMKSRALLPGQTIHLKEEEDEDPDPRFEMLRHVIDYCRFREAGKQLIHLEARQGGALPRGYMEEVDKPDRPAGLKFLSLDDLADLVDDVIERAKGRERVINGETWSVAQATDFLRNGIAAGGRFPFALAFSEEKDRDELIVIFLAVLEMMKSQEICVVDDGGAIFLMTKGESNE